MSKRFKNPSVVPSGMLAPSGNRQTVVLAEVQATTRPPGTILRPSPGYDSVRDGKNEFQGAGPTGGFRGMEFAEDIGGSGAALAVVPGDTARIDETEWLPTDEGDVEPGSLIISDRGSSTREAHTTNEGSRTVPDMGDRSIGRPLTRYLQNPYGMLRDDYKKNPIVTVLASAGAVFLVYLVGNDLEREYRGRRGRGIAAGTVAVPASAAATSGDEVERSTDAVSKAADKAVETINNATKAAVEAIDDAGKSVSEVADKAADEIQE